jgi:hypothetical protein
MRKSSWGAVLHVSLALMIVFWNKLVKKIKISTLFLEAEALKWKSFHQDVTSSISERK